LQNATYLDGLTVVELKDKKLTHFEHWEGQLLRFVNNLRKWGEFGTVKLHTNTTPKIYDRGKPLCLWAIAQTTMEIHLECGILSQNVYT
jgi:hypothetical protein